jgi:thiol-disulfide isomerase/thioredoxin
VVAQNKVLKKQELTLNVDTLKRFDFDELLTFFEAKDSQNTLVINFWATWCAPCVKELPYFEQLNTNYQSKNVEVILVSLDFPKHIESKLIPFLKERGLRSEVVVLDDVDSNTWIPKVDQNWSGAIPATIIYNANERRFYERSFNYQELETEIQKFIN